MTSPLSSPPAQDRPPAARRRWVEVLVAMLAVVAVVGATVLVLRVTSGDGSTSGAPAVTAPVGSAPAPSATSAPTPTPTPTPTTRSEESALTAVAPFLTAAARMDTRLRAAAVAINASGPPWSRVTKEAAAAVQAADLHEVASTIPTGLPPRILRTVVLVYSDLSSRRHAIQSFAFAEPLNLPGQRSTQELVAELRNGHVAATRFARDLAEARAVAAASPAVSPASPGSRAGAEARLLVAYVEVANGGCDQRGGVVLTALPAIHWHEANGWDGTMGPYGMHFRATLVAGSWEVEFDVC